MKKCKEISKEMIKMTIKELTARDINDLIDGNKTYVIEFGAEWCEPCNKFQPIYKEVAEETEELKFGKVDMEEDKSAAQTLGVRSLPTTVIIKEGEEVARKSGSMKKEELEKWLEDNLDET